MATFYLLPPRACLEQTLGEVLTRLLPGLPLPDDCWELLIEQLRVNWPDDVFLIPRDDLPEGEPVGESLVAGFGAESGDQVVVVASGRGFAPARTWPITPANVCGAVAAR